MQELATVDPHLASYPAILDDFKPHWRFDLTNEEYHADKTAVSSTGLKKILKSPLSFYSSHVLGIREEETDAFRFGSAFHMALLEPKEFAKSFIVAPEFKGLGSVAAKKEWRENQKKDAVILKEKEYADLIEMINSVERHPFACSILKNGRSEVSGYFTDPVTGIKCRIRPDFMHLGEGVLLDVKTTTDVESKKFSRTLWEYRYDFQMAFYSLGMELITGKPVRYPLYLAIEKKHPFECAVYSVDDIVLQKGKSDYDIAMKKLKECIESRSWLGYQNKIETISLPYYALKEGF